MCLLFVLHARKHVSIQEMLHNISISAGWNCATVMLRYESSDNVNSFQLMSP